MKRRLKWERIRIDEGIIVAYLGGIRIGNITYRSSDKEGVPMKYVVNCNLPGLQDMLGAFNNKDDAVYRIESAVNTWIKVAGLEENHERRK